MRAIRIHRFGGPEVLQLDEVDRPQPSAGELLIRVAAASVNPVDYKMRQGGYPRLKEEDLPAVLGRDVAGVIESAGGGFEAGDEVYVHLAWEHGGYAEYTLSTPEGIAKKPRSLSLVEAAAAPLAADTAWQGLFDHGALKAGERVLIHGASGGVGALAVQFAKVKGAHVIATASGGGVQAVKALGADEVIDYKAQRFEDAARDVDLVYDLVGGETQERSFAVLKPDGRLVSTLQITDKTKATAEEKGVKAERYMAKPSAENLNEIAGLIDAGKVKVTVTRTFPLEKAADAQRMLEEEHPRGKIVLTV